MNSENSNTSEPKKKKSDRSDKFVALSNLSMYYTWKNTNKSYKNNKFKKSAPTWNEKFDLPDGSCSVSDIQDYFEYILKNTERRLAILQKE